MEPRYCELNVDELSHMRGSVNTSAVLAISRHAPDASGTLARGCDMEARQARTAGSLT